MKRYTINDIKNVILSQSNRNVEARRFVNMLIGGTRKQTNMGTKFFNPKTVTHKRMRIVAPSVSGSSQITASETSNKRDTISNEEVKLYNCICNAWNDTILTPGIYKKFDDCNTFFDEINCNVNRSYNYNDESSQIESDPQQEKKF